MVGECLLGIAGAGRSNGERRGGKEPPDLFLSFVSLGDFSGQLLAYLSLGPIFIIVGFVTLIIFKRELHTVSPPLPSSFCFGHKSFNLCLAAPVFTLLFVLKSQLREGDLLSAAGDPVTCNRFHL